jgi:hypothetical protein
VIWVEATLLLSLRVLLFRGHYGLITEYTETYVSERSPQPCPSPSRPTHRRRAAGRPAEDD